jgi:hypothetical protein
MNPAWLFPVLAAIFLVLGLSHRLRVGRWHPANKTWLLLALIFGAVSVWLHWLR